MERGILYRKIKYIAAAALAFLVLFLLTYPKSERKGTEAVQIVAFGDSVFGLIQDETGIVSRLGVLLDKSVYCAGFGGTCVGRLDRGNSLDDGMESLSLVALTKAVRTGDFRPQQTIFFHFGSAVYFSRTIDGLKALDFDKVEIVLIEHGLNDYYSGIPLRNERDPMDEYTFAGALRSSLALLKERNPEARIVLVTPTYTWFLGEDLTCEEYDAGYGNQEVYIEEEMRIAEEYGIEVIDLYHDFFPHEAWDDWKLYTMDGMHPNEEGRRVIAEAIAIRLGKGEQR